MHPEPASMCRPLACVAAVNNDDVLNANLRTSPVIARGTAPLIVERGHASATTAYNAGIAKCSADVIVFAHQDVHLPLGWTARLEIALDYLEGRAVRWGVLGVFGVLPSGLHAGKVWSSGLAREVCGCPVTVPEPVVSLDEMVLVLNNRVGLRFDDDLPGFHLYGTDIVQTALAHGLGAFVIAAPAIHNSVPVMRLDRGYRAAYRYLQRKWRDRLPLHTCVVPVTRFALPLLRFNLRTPTRRLARALRPRTRHSSPDALARALGYGSQS